jgi:hypothetical protein
VIPVNGSAPVALCDAPLFWRASWGSDNSILYGTTGSIMRIPDKGGTPTSIIKAKAALLQFPQILPNGKSVLFEMHEPNKIMVQSLESGEPKELLAGASPRCLPTGHIVYAEETNLFAVPFDQDKTEMTGGRVSLVEGVYLSDFCLQYTVSDLGTLAYIPGVTGKSVAARTLVWVDRNGKEEPLGAQPDAYRAPKISPDGTKVALTLGMGRNSNIWIWDLFRRALTRLTYDKGEDSSPIWSLDGKRIVFASQREGARGIYWKAADGTGKIDKLSSGSNIFAGCFSWSGMDRLWSGRSGRFFPCCSLPIASCPYSCSGISSALGAIILAHQDVRAATGASHPGFSKGDQAKSSRGFLDKISAFFSLAGSFRWERESTCFGLVSVGRCSLFFYPSASWVSYWFLPCRDMWDASHAQ